MLWDSGEGAAGGTQAFLDLLMLSVSHSKKQQPCAWQRDVCVLLPCSGLNKGFRSPWSLQKAPEGCPDGQE